MNQEIERRRTFAIISHPDAGKTTLTEKLLLFGGQIQVAGAVKSHKIKKTATSGQLISQIDILASLAKIIGAQIPLATAQDSQDFSDLLIGKSKKGREWIIQQNQFNKLAIQNVEGWKYIEPSSYPAYNPNTNIELGSSPKEQLYNLKNDPGEKNNLAERNEAYAYI